VDLAELELPLELEGLLAWREQKIVLIQEPTQADLERWRAEGWLAIDYDSSAETILAALQGAPR
jgi:hypothetical protein